MTTRFGLAGIVALTLPLIAACGANGPQEDHAEAVGAVEAVEAGDAVSVGQLLRAGKPEACAHPAVKELILSELRPPSVDLDNPAIRQAVVLSRYKPTNDELIAARDAIGEPILSEFQAVNVEPDVGEMICEVNLSFGPESTPSAFRYMLRPSLENSDDFIIKQTFDTEGVSIWQQTILGAAINMAQQRENSQNAQTTP